MGYLSCIKYYYDYDNISALPVKDCGRNKQLPVWLCRYSKCSILQDVQTVNNDCSSLLQQSRLESLVSWEQILKEKTSHTHACTPTKGAECSSVRANAQKKRTSSSKQIRPEPRMADMASNIKKDLYLDCIWQSHGWPSRTQDGTGVVMAELCLQSHTTCFQSLL